MPEQLSSNFIADFRYASCITNIPTTFQMSVLRSLIFMENANTHLYIEVNIFNTTSCSMIWKSEVPACMYCMIVQQIFPSWMNLRKKI